MSLPHFLATGTNYTGTIGFVAAGLLFVPAVLAISQPNNSFAVYLALACSLICLVFARISWTSASRQTMPSIGVDTDIRTLFIRPLPGDPSPVRITTPKRK
jgi:hypothetical protein